MSASDPRPVVIPRVNVNEDSVTISRIAVNPGDRVRPGEIIFSMGTSKADVDVDASAEGYFWPAVEVGDQVDVGAVVGYICATPERPRNLSKPATRAAAPQATQKAAALAADLGVDLAEMDQRGIIRERDVETFAARRRGPGSPLPGPTPIVPTAVSGTGGRLDTEFLTAIRRPESGFSQLSSELKVILYRAHGASIGTNVTFGPGAAIFADRIEVGDNSQLGANTVIRAEELHIGVGCIFGTDNDIMCRHIHIGDMLFLVNRVLIGQGGAFNEEAELIVGHSCLISSDSLINTASRVSIGDRSCLSPRVSIFTHSHWQNVLDGYQATFAPVMIGNDVWITGNCLITPGTVMEDGSQALANSVVSGRVPGRTIVSGAPAQPFAKVRGDLSVAEKDRLMQRIWRQVESAVRRAGLDPGAAAYTGATPAAGVRASVQVAFGSRPEGYGGTFFDLNTYRVTGPDSPLADEVRNVLRKNGIRFEPHTWRYRADADRYNA